MATKKTEIAKEETAIVPTAATRELTPGIWRMITDMAPVMYKAHLFGVQSPEQAAAIMLKGYDCGFSITASFDFIQVIQGKPSVNPRGAMALLLSSDLVSELKVERLEEKGTFAGYRCTMTRKNGFSFTSKFTLDDAKRAGLLKPDSGWHKYPENMCMWRAIGFAADVVFPDVTAGMTSLMKAPEMYGVGLTQEGDIVDVTPEPVSIDPLQALIQEFGADAVVNAADGITGTPEEIANAVRAKLEGAKV